MLGIKALLLGLPGSRLRG